MHGTADLEAVGRRNYGALVTTVALCLAAAHPASAG
jgi:hypothetical protein